MGSGTADASERRVEGEGKGESHPPGGECVLQADDGQFVFADALSCRLILQHFGSWGQCPELIEAGVVEMQAHRQSAEEGTRKRFRALAHLPMGASFHVCELELSGLVSTSVLESAREPLARRAERRVRVKGEEERARAAERRRRERERQLSGKSELAAELEMLSFSQGRRTGGEAEQAPSIQVHAEWQSRWERQQVSGGLPPLLLI